MAQECYREANILALSALGEKVQDDKKKHILNSVVYLCALGANRADPARAAKAYTNFFDLHQ